MDQYENSDEIALEGQALPPRGNLSMGGATVEEPQPSYEQNIGATTVNGGRAPEGNPSQPNSPQQPQAEPQQQTPQQGMYAPQGTWGAQQAYVYPQQMIGANPYQQPQTYGTPVQQPAFPQYGNPAPQTFSYANTGAPSYSQTAWQPYTSQPMQQGSQQPIQPYPQEGMAPQGSPSASLPLYVPEKESNAGRKEDSFDYSNIDTSARVAIYDDLHSAPRVIRIPGGPTHEFIERIASLTYQHSQSMGGRIPYSVIREVSENFIHAQFKEVVVSILDKGDTIRFTDQGPGIKDKNLVQLPGVTSATEPMKQYIRGVGSGLPLVKDALSFNHGTITIEDNVNSGSVVTISLVRHPTTPGAVPPSEAATGKDRHTKITGNDKLVLSALREGPAGVSAVSRETGISVSSVHNSFERLTQAGLVAEEGKERYLTEQGIAKLEELA